MNDPRVPDLVKQYTSQVVSLEDLGLQHGVTRERIRQLLKKAGVTAKDSYRRLSKTVRRAAQKREQRNNHCLAVYGCDFAAFQKVTGVNRLSDGVCQKPIIKMWKHHVRYSRRQLSEWQFTLPEYAEFVGPRLHEISCSKNGIVLSRKDKNGPFSKANCELITLKENSLRTGGFAVGHKRTAQQVLELVRRTAEMFNAGQSRPEIAKALRKCKDTVDVYIRRAKTLGLLK